MPGVQEIYALHFLIFCVPFTNRCRNLHLQLPISLQRRRQPLTCRCSFRRATRVGCLAKAWPLRQLSPTHQKCPPQFPHLLHSLPTIALKTFAAQTIPPHTHKPSQNSTSAHTSHSDTTKYPTARRAHAFQNQHVQPFRPRNRPRRPL